jgi:hypothetical protein
MSTFVSIKPSNIPFLYSKPLQDVQFEAITSWEYCDLSQITNWIITKNIKLNPGDIIGFAPLVKLYRNGSKCVCYSNSVHDLEYDCDEYGAIPNAPELYVRSGHFHPRYWSDVITHNGIYWICDEYRLECVNNIEVIITNDNKKRIYSL